MVYVQLCMHASMYKNGLLDMGSGGESSERVEHRHRYRYARSYSNHVSRRGECVQSKGPEGISGLDVINMDMDAGEAWAGLGVGVDVGVCVGWIICKPSSITKKKEDRVYEYGSVCESLSCMYWLRAVRARNSREAAVPGTLQSRTTRAWVAFE